MSWYIIPHQMMPRSVIFLWVSMKITPEVYSRCCCDKLLSVVCCLNSLLISYSPAMCCECLDQAASSPRIHGLPRAMESSFTARGIFHGDSEIRRILSTGFQSKMLLGQGQSTNCLPLRSLTSGLFLSSTFCSQTGPCAGCQILD